MTKDIPFPIKLFLIFITYTLLLIGIAILAS